MQGNYSPGFGLFLATFLARPFHRLRIELFVYDERNTVFLGLLSYNIFLSKQVSTIRRHVPHARIRDRNCMRVCNRACSN